MRMLAGDLWGGLAAAVVALPAAIGFGVAVYEPLGQSFNAQGVMAGMIGATLLAALAYRVALAFVVRRRRHFASHPKPDRSA